MWISLAPLKKCVSWRGFSVYLRLHFVPSFDNSFRLTLQYYIIDKFLIACYGVCEGILNDIKTYPLIPLRG